MSAHHEAIASIITDIIKHSHYAFLCDIPVITADGDDADARLTFNNEDYEYIVHLHCGDHVEYSVTSASGVIAERDDVTYDDVDNGSVADDIISALKSHN